MAARAARPTGLGRGIASLIPTASESSAGEPQSTQNAAAPEQPRTPILSGTSKTTDRTAHIPKTDVQANTTSEAANVITLHHERQTQRAAEGRASAPRRRPVDVFFEREGDAEVSKRAWDDAAASGRLGFTDPAQPSHHESLDGDPTVATAAEADSGLKPVQGIRFAELIVDLIRPNPWQPRTVFDEADLAELTDSIAEIGLLQPIVVRERADGYELIMGERRWRAAQRAGLRRIPALVRDTDDTAMLRDALLENLHRANLNPLEEATAYRQLLDDFGCTQEELATKIAKSRSQISNTLRLLKLPPLIQKRLAKGDLQAGHARAILGLSDTDAMEALAQRVVAEGLSVRTVEEIVAQAVEQPITRKRTIRSIRSPQTDQLAVRLSERFAAKVNVRLGAVGKMTIEFDDVANLNRILALIAPDDPGVGDTEVAADPNAAGSGDSFSEDYDG